MTILQNRLQMLPKAISLDTKGTVSEEIELEVELLADTLTKLYKLRHLTVKTTSPKRARTGKGTSTEGLKRKTMDEDVEAEKIRAVEARMALFEKGAAATNNGNAGHGAGGSDKSSDSNDSGRDSELPFRFIVVDQRVAINARSDGNLRLSFYRVVGHSQYTMVWNKLGKKPKRW